MQASGSSVHSMRIEALNTRYSLVCHETRTKVVVGGDGACVGEMLSALITDASREALCVFLMHNHGHALYLIAENWANVSEYPLYHEFLGGAEVHYPGDNPPYCQISACDLIG